jgi:cytochrome c2
MSSSGWAAGGCSLLFEAGLALLLLAGGAQGAVDHGEMLLDQLSCTACHDAAPRAQDRFVTHDGPRLGGLGLRLTPQWLRAFLADPDQVHPGNTMPDMLHGMAPDEKARAVEDLTQYLISREAPEDPPFDCGPGLIEKGRELYHTVGCVACHSPWEMPARAADDSRARAELQGLEGSPEEFADLPRMTSVPQLAAFLRDPVGFHPAGRMPSMNLSDSEATAIAAYLLREQTQQGAQSVPGVSYEIFQERFGNLPNFDRLAPVATGSVPAFEISARWGDDEMAVRYRGSVQIPAQGEYRFFTASADGSKLLIDNQPVVDNDGIHPMTEQSGSIILAPGPHAITVLYFSTRGDLGLTVSWQGPGFGKEQIPGSALSHPGGIMTPRGEEPFSADGAGVERGRALFAQLNCAACHLGETVGAKAKPLAELTLTGTADCLSPNPAGGLPRYWLAPADGEAIRRTLSDPTRLPRPLDPRESIERTMTLLDCYACHDRGGQGGPEGLRRDYFSSLPPDLDLGDEGRLPPSLTGAGARLQEAWIGSVLLDGAVARPYMATRMPQFGRRNVGFLAAAFLAADGSGVVNPDLQGDTAAQRAGRRLVGVTGLGCIGCHNFEGHPSLGIPAMDLALMTQRLQTGWFRRYLIDPQSLRPGTRIPSFWPGGRAVNGEIEEGHTGRQIAALWTYLMPRQATDLPDGLIHGRMELVADKQAVIYRNFIRGVGPRAIAVGYPEKANLAFDADDMRIALVWQGPFIDAAQQRTGYGMGTTPPLGHDVLAGPPGPPFALRSGPDDPWPALTGKSAGYQFRGYHLDDELRPAFSYYFGGIHVTDYPVAVPGKEDPGLKRILTFQAASPPANLYMRAAVGDKIERLPNGDFLVDGRLALGLSGSGATVRTSQGRMELLWPIRFSGNKASIEEDYTW